MTYMGDEEKFKSFDDEYYGGSELEREIEGAAVVEEEDPFKALDDFAVEGNAVDPAVEKDAVVDVEIESVVDPESASTLVNIELSADKENLARGKGKRTAAPAAKIKAARSKKAPVKKKAVKKPAKKSSAGKKKTKKR